MPVKTTFSSCAEHSVEKYFSDRFSYMLLEGSGTGGEESLLAVIGAARQKNPWLLGQHTNEHARSKCDVDF